MYTISFPYPRRKICASLWISENLFDQFEDILLRSSRSSVKAHNQMNHFIQKAFIFNILFLSFSIAFAIPVSSSSKCILKNGISSSGIDSNCMMGSWNGLLNNCRGLDFREYLQALAWRANQTGQIFLNSTQQYDCLSSIKSNDNNISRCGIEKLTVGSGGCSDYSVNDVFNKLGNRLNSLSEDCKLLGSDGGSGQDCSRCSQTWEEMSTFSSNSNDSILGEPDVCRYAMLISLISQRITDSRWFQEIYNCLGDQSLHQDIISPASSINDQGNKSHRVMHFSGGFWILIIGIVGFIVSLMVAFYVHCRRKAKKVPKAKEVPKSSIYEESSNQMISIKDVYAATNNLSASNLIGQGIAGKVYKGVTSDGQHIAVKHIVNDGHMETFVREVKSLSHIKHPNLVPLLGHCDGNDECFLIYELCHNGNLSQWLFGKEKTLSWIQRLHIAIDCARGLWFLHTYPGGYIVHRDIKPTNILICANFEGKLSDFGLSKVMNMGQSFVSSEVRGTFGYVDPEYQKNRHVNSSGDVYSFGIVLLQILSGQRVINMDMQRPMHLNKMAKSLTKGGSMNEFADPKLNGEYSFEAFELVFKLALSCTGLKQQRPSMDQVVGQLEQALDISTSVKSVSTSFYM